MSTEMLTLHRMLLAQHDRAGSIFPFWGLPLDSRSPPFLFLSVLPPPMGLAPG